MQHKHLIKHEVAAATLSTHYILKDIKNTKKRTWQWITNNKGQRVPVMEEYERDLPFTPHATETQIIRIFYHLTPTFYIIAPKTAPANVRRISSFKAIWFNMLVIWDWFVEKMLPLFKILGVQKTIVKSKVISYLNKKSKIKHLRASAIRLLGCV